ncbi:hypothetical protein J6590_053368 [Homalodisca vitripennis]|nr:hypothetical protein J6590_053368 [Homalodisca vitripennis]
MTTSQLSLRRVYIYTSIKANSSWMITMLKLHFASYITGSRPTCYAIVIMTPVRILDDNITMTPVKPLIHPSGYTSTLCAYPHVSAVPCAS